jgi:hypothetical protein
LAYVYRRTSISGTKKAKITFPLRHISPLKVSNSMVKSGQIAWKIVPLRHFFPLKVVPLIEVLLYITIGQDNFLTFSILYDDFFLDPLGSQD